MYGMSRSRSASAITSEPQPGALALVRLAGRSISLRDGCAAVEISAAGAALAVAVLTGQSLFDGRNNLPGAIKSDRRPSRNLAKGRGGRQRRMPGLHGARPRFAAD